MKASKKEKAMSGGDSRRRGLGSGIGAFSHVIADHVSEGRARVKSDRTIAQIINDDNKKAREDYEALVAAEVEIVKALSPIYCIQCGEAMSFEPWLLTCKKHGSRVGLPTPRSWPHKFCRICGKKMLREECDGNWMYRYLCPHCLDTGASKKFYKERFVTEAKRRLRTKPISISATLIIGEKKVCELPEGRSIEFLIKKIGHCLWLGFQVNRPPKGGVKFFTPDGKCFSVIQKRWIGSVFPGRYELQITGAPARCIFDLSW